MMVFGTNFNFIFFHFKLHKLCCHESSTRYKINSQGRRLHQAAIFQLQKFAGIKHIFEINFLNSHWEMGLLDFKENFYWIMQKNCPHWPRRPILWPQSIPWFLFWFSCIHHGDTFIPIFAELWMIAARVCMIFSFYK